MIAKLLLQNLVWVIVLGALLFVPAGTLHWSAAWLFLATIGILGVAGGFWLARHDPALLLGSWWGIAMSPLLALLFAGRIVIEERALAAGLPGYADYTTRVRYRLVPGLW